MYVGVCEIRYSLSYHMLCNIPRAFGLCHCDSRYAVPYLIPITGYYNNIFVDDMRSIGVNILPRLKIIGFQQSCHLLV